MKRTPLKRTTLRKVRTEPRPGRLKGEDMHELREQSWEQHNGVCIFCGTYVARSNFELAHRRGKRMHGDSLENVGPAHRWCHRDSHSPKACPKGEWRGTMDQ